MMRPPGDRDRMLKVVLETPNQATALCFGAAVYALHVTRLTGKDPSVPLSGLILENAAEALRRSPDAATRFRELMQLSTPWT